MPTAKPAMIDPNPSADHYTAATSAGVEGAYTHAVAADSFLWL